MNFDYSYRAFLISCLLVGNLVLLLVSVKMTKKVAVEEDFTAVEYSEEILEEEEEALLDVSEMVKIETNRAYNEAEEFISELEDSRDEALDNSEENDEADAKASEENSLDTNFALNEAQDKLDKVKERLANDAKTRNAKATISSNNRKTTISYSLAGRQALRLRNPVYTCESGGKIVINIEVNELGKVIKTSFNRSASTTDNGCLIDSAIAYATNAKFNTAASKESQIGTITYTFPGQN